MDTILDKEVMQEDMIKMAENLFSVIPGISYAERIPTFNANRFEEKDFITNWITKNKPCLIKNAVKDWPIMAKAKDKNYWISTCKNLEVTIYPHMNHNSKSLGAGERILFHDAVDRLFKGSDYIFSMPAETMNENNGFAEVLKDIGDFAFLPKSEMPRIYDRRRFFLYRRAASAWHYHGVDETLLCQLSGVKRVALLPPDIPRPKHVTHFLQNELHLKGQKLNADLELKPMIADIEEGDSLYIPPYWHHGVVPLDGGIGVSLAFCWRSGWFKLGDFSNFFVREVYKQGIWPVNKFTPFLPFLGMYSAMSYYFKRATRQI